MTYIVKSGDSLSKIAKEQLGDENLWPEIATLNKIKNVNLIIPGQELDLDIPKNTQVQSGGTGPVTKANTSGSSSSWIWWTIGIVLIVVVAVIAIKKYKLKYH